MESPLKVAVVPILGFSLLGESSMASIEASLYLDSAMAPYGAM